MPDDLVGINLDTLNDMKEQFEEVQTKNLKTFNQLVVKAECLEHQVESILETLETQTRVLKIVFNKLDEYAEYDENMRELVDLFAISSSIGLLDYDLNQKWLLYKTTTELKQRLNEEKTILSVSLS